MQDKRLSVILSSNITHYSYTALALHEQGYLQRYISSIMVRDFDNRFINLLPVYWKRKLRGRSLEGISKSKVVSLWLHELVQKGLISTSAISMDRINWITANIYDLISKKHVDNCDVFHFVSSIGLYSARKAKQQGSFIICDERACYSDYWREILIEEYENLGIRYKKNRFLNEDRTKAEYDIADLIITPSGFAKRTFTEYGFEENKFRVIPYGVNQAQFNSLANQYIDRNNHDKFIILFAGRITPQKGVHYLVDAFNMLNLPNVELWLFGNVDNIFMDYSVEVAKDNPRIKIFGSVPKIDLIRYYSQASVFVLPSLADSWGLVCLEAMAMGIPVIVTENTGSKEVVINGENGYIIPIRDSESISSKIEFLYNNSDFRIKMGNAAANAISNYSWESYKKRINELYGELSVWLSKN